MIYGKKTAENEPAGYIMFDVIMPVTRHHNNIACLSIMSLMRNVKPRRIYVVTARDNFSFFEKLQNQDPVMVLDENSLIPGVNLPSIIKFIENAGQNHSRAGWYFQQFLKMYACFLPDITDHYLIWDADTVMLNPIRFLNEQNQTLIKPSPEYHQPYFETYERLLGKTRSINYSFISEHFFIVSAYMKELIAAIEEHATLKSHWVWNIMNAVDTEHLSGSGFSEFETYGNFVNTVHPGTFALRPLASTRYGARKFGPIPNRYDLYRLSLSNAYASFESWDTEGRPLKIWMEKLLSAFIYYADLRRYLRSSSRPEILRDQNARIKLT